MTKLPPSSNPRQHVRLLIEGMTCSKCVQHVDSALSALGGVHEMMTTLKPEGATEVVVTLNSEISDEAFTHAIEEEAGYTLVGIERR